MLRGLWRLTWLEIKIFVREPLGRVRHDRHSGDPVHRHRPPSRPPCANGLARSAALHFGGSADLRVAADRAERRAVARDDHRHLPGRRHPEAAAGDAASRRTPSWPRTCWSSCCSTAVTLAMMILAGRRSSTRSSGCSARRRSRLALLFSTWHSRFAGVPDCQPRSDRTLRATDWDLIIYPMLGLSGLFLPLSHCRRRCRRGPRAAVYICGVAAAWDLAR